MGKQGKCSCVVIWSPVLARSCQARAAGGYNHLRYSFSEEDMVKNKQEEGLACLSAWQAAEEWSRAGALAVWGLGQTLGLILAATETSNSVWLAASAGETQCAPVQSSLPILRCAGSVLWWDLHCTPDQTWLNILRPWTCHKNISANTDFLVFSCAIGELKSWWIY